MLKKVAVTEQKIVPQKIYNRYKLEDRVLLFSNTYRWGVVKFIAISRDKKSFVYTIVFGDGSAKPMKCKETELLPFIKKWQWKVLTFLRIVY